MKIFLIIGTLAVIVGVVLLVLFFSQKQSVPVGTQNPAGLPVAPSTVTTGTQTPPAPTTITIVANGGATIVTKDFIRNNITLADPSNAGNYILTGSSTDGYSIGYRTPAQFFTIALEKEPLGETRTAAENFLLSTLGISQSQLCSLNYYLGTDVHTNSLYAGKNLGFSFCPGATKLPQ